MSHEPGSPSARELTPLWVRSLCPLKPGDAVRLNAKGWLAMPQRPSMAMRIAAYGTVYVESVDGQEVEPGRWRVRVSGPLGEGVFDSACFEKLG